MFIERVQAVREDFIVTPGNAASIVAMCRHLDGLPLAIELAAVRLKVVSPADLLARLEHSLPLLTGGGRDLPTRQQTMRDAIAWSYELLAGREQALFRRLAVFVGGVSLAAAEDAARSVAGPTADALGLLATLVDSSLLHVVPGPGERMRYLMLETIREFGQEQLVLHHELDAVRDAHATFFVRLGAWLDPNVIPSGMRFDDHLVEIEVEQPNLLAALAHLDASGNVADLLMLAGNCSVIWHHRGYLTDGRRWLEHALAVTPPEPTVVRGTALAGLSLVAWTQGYNDVAAPPATAALAIAQANGAVPLEALALHMLGLIELRQGCLAEGRDCMEQALARWLVLDTPTNEAMARMMLAEFCLRDGDDVGGSQLANQALEIFRREGHASGAAFSLLRLAQVAMRQADERTAFEQYRAAYRLWAGIGERWAIVAALLGMTLIAAQHGQLPAAATLLGGIDARLHLSGVESGTADQIRMKEVEVRCRSTLGDDRFEACRQQGRNQSLPDEGLLIDGITMVGDDARVPTVAGPDALTARERDVLRLLAEAKSNAEIADALFIGVRTVRTHVANILAKLGVSTRTAAATWAIRHHLD